MQIKYVERIPTPQEYNMLTEAVGWGTKENEIIEACKKPYICGLTILGDEP